MEQVRNEDIDALAVIEIENSIREGIPEQADLEAVHTIYRVPKLLRQANDMCFEPQLLSIGPFHHGKEGLKPMEQKKLKYLRAILSRNGKELKDCVKEIMKVVAQARECYSGSISLGEKEFAKMIVVDGCFLVEMFLQIRTKYLAKTLPQFISKEMWLPDFTTHDMLLLENQIPFFILQSIFCFVEEPGSIKDLVLLCFKVFPVLPLNDDPKAKAEAPYHHLLDLFHHHCLPSTSEKNHETDPDIGEQFHQTLENRPVLTRVEEQSPPNLEVRIEGTPVEEHSLPEERWGGVTPEVHLESMAMYKPSDSTVPTGAGKPREESNGRTEQPEKYEQLPFEIPSAEELVNSGIKFLRKEETPGSFLDIKFRQKRPVMKIPYIYFSDSLLFIFRNFIAYEQCNPKVGTFFTGYALFMHDLIDTAEDVRILRSRRILKHGLGSDEELAKYFNQLSKGIFHHAEDAHLYRERMEINKYCRSNIIKPLLSLFHKFYRFPSFVEFVGLYLSAVQTFLSIKLD